MRIAILGAGFAGLAVTWYLLHYKQGSISIDLYDPEPIGGGVSGMSSGLLHTYPGKEARKSWRAPYCIKETHRLITESSRGIDRSLILSKGILRPALTEEQHRAFKNCADENGDTEWWDAELCMNRVSGLFLPKERGGLYIKEGLTLDVPGYLQGLWQTVAKFGVQFHQTAMIDPKKLEKYDAILIALGAVSKSIPALQKLPITPIKGQLLKLEWPHGVPPLPMSLVGNKYLVMNADYRSCTVGATFEREFDSAEANRERAAAEILPPITSFFPSLEKVKILDCHAGFRATTPNHLPLVGKASEKLYFFTGLGSKGLLYHAWVGKRVARAILTHDINHLPSDIRHVL